MLHRGKGNFQHHSHLNKWTRTGWFKAIKSLAIQPCLCFTHTLTSEACCCSSISSTPERIFFASKIFKVSCLTKFRIPNLRGEVCKAAKYNCPKPYKQCMSAWVRSPKIWCNRMISIDFLWKSICIHLQFPVSVPSRAASTQDTGPHRMYTGGTRVTVIRTCGGKEAVFTTPLDFPQRFQGSL